MPKTDNPEKINISGVFGIPETMLIPLWARATETKRSDGVIRDDFAVQMVERIDYDFSKFEPAWRSQVGCAIRAKLFDDAVRSFVRKNPGCLVVNLGCGLDTRYERLRDEQIEAWFDLDLPEAIALRRQFLSEGDNNRFIACSVFDLSWMHEIRTRTRPLLFVAEGLFMYFPKEKNRTLFDRMIAHFPGAEMLLETLGPWLVGNSRHHDSVHMVGKAPEFLWGEKNTRDMERWNSGLRYIEEWNFFDYYPKRWGNMRWFFLIPGFNRHMCNRITHFQFSPKGRNGKNSKE